MTPERRPDPIRCRGYRCVLGGQTPRRVRRSAGSEFLGRSVGSGLLADQALSALAGGHGLLPSRPWPLSSCLLWSRTSIHQRSARRRLQRSTTPSLARLAPGCQIVSGGQARPGAARSLGFPGGVVKPSFTTHDGREPLLECAISARFGRLRRGWHEPQRPGFRLCHVARPVEVVQPHFLSCVPWASAQECPPSRRTSTRSFGR